MSRYLISRLLAAIPVLLGVSVITFALVRFIPGDPVQVMLGPEVIGNRAAEIRALYGLDRPWPVQYVEWLSRAAQGNLGTSLLSGLPVSESIVQKLPVTIELTILSFALGLAVGLPLAVAAAQNRG